MELTIYGSGLDASINLKYSSGVQGSYYERYPTSNQYLYPMDFEANLTECKVKQIT